MEDNRSNKSFKNTKYSPNINGNFLKTLKNILERSRSLIESKKEPITSFVEFEFEPRLLESLLLISYFDLYSAINPINVKEIINDTFITTNNPLILNFLDLNIQNLLLRLYNMKSELFTSISLQREVSMWIDDYQNLLSELFMSDLEQGNLNQYSRKILFFNLLATYITADIRVKKILNDNLVHLSSKISSTEQDFDSHDVWQRVYYILLYIIVKWNSYSLPSNLTVILRKLLDLQSDNGTWQKNHFLTLLVIHTLRYFQLDKAYPELIPRIKQAENYLLMRNSGLSVLDSRRIYNSVVFYFYRWLFEGELPPLDLVSSLLISQNNDGGWPYQPNMLLSDVDTTIFVLLTLIPYSQQLDVMKYILHGLNFIQRTVQERDYSRFLFMSEITPIITAHLIMLYTLLPSDFIKQKERKKLIMDLLNTLIQSQLTHTLFKNSVFSFSEIYPISQVALAIFTTTTSPITKDLDFYNRITTLKHQFHTFLEQIKNLDGGCRPKREIQSPSEQQSTCYAIITWALLEPTNIQLFKAWNWLKESMDGEIRSFPEYTEPHPIRYNDLIHGPLYVYLASVCSIHKRNPLGLYPPIHKKEIENSLVI